MPAKKVEILLKKFLLCLIIILFLITVCSFVFGYFKIGIGTGFALIWVAMGAANVYSQKNEEYLHNKWHEDYVRNRR